LSTGKGRVFKPMREAATERCLISHNNGLYQIYYTPGIIRAMKPTKRKWMRHVARMRRE
jgi:hypothetical protein